MNYSKVLSHYGGKYGPGVYGPALQKENAGRSGDQWDKSFAEKVRQAAQEFGFKESEAAEMSRQWRSEADRSGDQYDQDFKESARKYAEEMGFKRDQADRIADQWASEFGFRTGQDGAGR